MDSDQLASLYVFVDFEFNCLKSTLKIFFIQVPSVSISLDPDQSDTLSP